MIELEQCDPRNFWKLIGKMNEWGKAKTDPTSNVPAETWKRHFQTLLNENSSERGKQKESRFYRKFDPTLDGIITKKELESAFKRFKDDKAPGPDKLLSEYLKVFNRAAENIVVL